MLNMSGERRRPRMPKPSFPYTIDSSMLSTFRSCPRKFYLQYVCHWKSKNESVHLHAGGAFAAGIEAARRAFFLENMNQDEAIAAGLQTLIQTYGDFECPPESAKSLNRMCGALEYYGTLHPFGHDGMKPIMFGKDHTGIELSFARPLEFNHPTLGDPLLYTGRSDLVAEYLNGVYIVDEKTASQLGATWGRQWELRSQFTGYCWGCQGYGIEAAGIMVRGISILKTKYDHLEILTYRSRWEIERWYVQVHRDLERMLKCWEDDYWDYNLDHACTEYGGCSMVQICKSPTPDTWLDMYFERRVWDPLERKQISLEEYEAKWNPNPAEL